MQLVRANYSNELEDGLRGEQELARELNVEALGPVMVVAPHPDDETLGCGGLIARCASLGKPVTVLAMTTGDASHPGDAAWRARLARIRGREQLAALCALGVNPPDLVSMSLPDGSLDSMGMEVETEILAEITSVIRARGICSVFLPATDDCHSDHRATARLVCRGLKGNPVDRVFSYQIWPPDRRALHVVANEQPYYLDMRDLVGVKRRAIQEHRSQLGVVDEAHTEGFRMPEELLREKLKDREVYGLIKDLVAWSQY